MKDNFDIYALLLKQHYEQLTPEEEKEVEARLATDPTLQELQREIRSVPKEEAEEFLRNIDIDKELGKAIESMAENKKRNVTYRRLVIAAASAAVIMGAFFFFGTDSTTSPGNTYAATTPTGATLTLASGEVIAMSDSGAQKVTAAGTQVSNTNRSLSYQLSQGKKGPEGLNVLYVPRRLDFKVALSDGSIVWLNSTTRFRFPFSFSGGTRDVYMDEGEAYFEVAPNAAKPFIVHTSKGKVKVLGTAFNVNNYVAGKVVTSLVSGKVAFSAGDRMINLTPGMQVIAEQDKLTERTSFDQENTLSWRQGIHYFDNVTVKEVSVMLKRWFDVSLTIDNEQAANTEIRGKLNRNQPLDIFLEQVNGTKLVTFYWDYGKLHCK